jgi:hypothetical protein
LRQTKDGANEKTPLSALWKENGPELEKILSEAQSAAEKLSNGNNI